MKKTPKVVPMQRPRAAAATGGDKFVRVRNMRDDGFVEFDFSIGDPTLYVELILPSTAFNEFCNANGVTFLDDDQADAIDRDRRKWREGYISQEGEEVQDEDAP